MEFEKYYNECNQYFQDILKGKEEAKKKNLESLCIDTKRIGFEENSLNPSELNEAIKQAIHVEKEFRKNNLDHENKNAIKISLSLIAAGAKISGLQGALKALKDTIIPNLPEMYKKSMTSDLIKKSVYETNEAIYTDKYIDKAVSQLYLKKIPLYEWLLNRFIAEYSMIISSYMIVVMVIIKFLEHFKEVVVLQEEIVSSINEFLKIRHDIEAVLEKETLNQFCASYDEYRNYANNNIRLPKNHKLWEMINTLNDECEIFYDLCANRAGISSKQYEKSLIQFMKEVEVANEELKEIYGEVAKQLMDNLHQTVREINTHMARYISESGYVDNFDKSMLEIDGGVKKSDFPTEIPAYIILCAVNMKYDHMTALVIRDILADLDENNAEMYKKIIKGKNIGKNGKFTLPGFLDFVEFVTLPDIYISIKNTILSPIKKYVKEKPDRQLGITVPYAQNTVKGAGLVINYANDSRKFAQEKIQELILDLFTSIPIGKLETIMIDIMEMGMNFASLHKVVSASKEAGIKSKICTKVQEIEQVMAEFHSQSEKAIMRYGTDYSARLENEPIRMLAIANFPRGFSKNALSDLYAILRNREKLGVFIFITMEAESLEAFAREQPKLVEEMGKNTLWTNAVAGNWCLNNIDVLERYNGDLDKSQQKAIVDRLAEKIQECCGK